MNLEVQGKVTYDPVTYEAVFQPDQDLTIATTYTVTVITEVMDLAGQNMTQDVSSQFSTTTVWFVDQKLAASGAGQSWATAFRSIEETLTAASGKDHIWVKQGAYLLTHQMVVEKPVVLLGGLRAQRPRTISVTGRLGQQSSMRATAIIVAFTF